jgi:phytoene dehydrogenase-like protein
MGGHALYAGGPGIGVLRSLGIEPAGSQPPLDKYKMRYQGELHMMPSSPTTVARTSIFGLRAKAQFSKLLLGVARLDPSKFADVSFSQWLADHDLRPEVEAVVKALARTGSYTADMDHLSADAAITQLQSSAAHGVLYLDGGFQQLIDGLAAKVEVRTGAAVERLEPAGGRVEVVAGEQRFVAGSVVLAAGSPAAVASLLPGDPGWGDLGEPLTAACLDIGTRKVPTPGWIIDVDEPLFVTTQSPPAKQAPAGGAVVEVLRYDSRNADTDRPDLEAALRRGGVADEDIVVRRFLAHMVVTATAPRPWLGGIGGRPAVDATGVPNVFIAGDWVGPQGVLADASLVSGQEAARRALHAVEHSATMVA